MDFFRTLAQRVAENLLHHVDGRVIERRKVSEDVNIPDSDRVARLNLSEYNFPPNFRFDTENDTKVDFLLECNLKEADGEQRPLNLVGANVRDENCVKNDCLFLCCVCGESFSSVHQFDEHEVNNHPNVVCSYVEIDFFRNIPLQLLSWQYNSPNGVLRRCVVPPSLANLSNEQTFKCTKCSRCFTLVGQLHQHIVDCASLNEKTKQSDEEKMAICESNSVKTSSNCSHKSRKRKAKRTKKGTSKSAKLEVEDNDEKRCDVAIQVCLANRNVISNDLDVKGEECNKSLMSATPKRYSCAKCTKKFVFLVTLKKHQMSCSKLLFRRRKPKTFKNIIRKIICNKKSDICCKKYKIKNGNNKFKRKVKLSERRDVDVVKDKSDLSSASNSKANPKSQSNCNKTTTLASQEHRCPRCSRVFSYLANFKKHIKKSCSGNALCESMCEKSAEEAKVGEADDESTVSDKANEAHLSDNEATETELDNVNDYEPQTLDQDLGNDLEGNYLNVTTKDNSKLDLWRIKQEHPLYAFKGSPAQHHSCPYCQRGFTYLANYRKHINGICPIRQQIDKTKRDNDESVAVKTDTNSQTNNVCQSAVLRTGNVEENVSIEWYTILRDQTKLNEMTINHDSVKANCNNREELRNASEAMYSLETPANEVKENNAVTEEIDGQKFRTFSCNICHRIYLSHVKMLRHMLSHKLAEGSSNASSESVDDPSEENAIAKQALQRQTSDAAEKRKKLSNYLLESRVSKQPDIPCARLLENLARGGTVANSLPFLSELD